MYFTNGVESVPSGQMIGVCAVCCCWFSTTICFRMNFCHFVFSCVTVNTLIILASGTIFSYFPLFFLSAFLTGALLDTNHIFLVSTLFRWTMDYNNGFFLCYNPFWEKCYTKWRLALRKPLDPSYLSLFKFKSFLRLSCTFMYCVDDCLLLPLFDITLLMGPNGLPLQVNNPPDIEE